MEMRSSLMLWAALSCALTIFATPVFAAIAGQPDAADVKTVDACLADAAKTKGDPDICIGHVSNDCMANAQATATKEACSSRELLVWTAALNRDFAQLMTLLTDDNAKRVLRDAQRDFFVATLKRCTFERLAHKDSAASLVAAGQCDVRATAQQDLWLLEQIGSFSSP